MGHIFFDSISFVTHESAPEFLPEGIIGEAAFKKWAAFLGEGGNATCTNNGRTERRERERERKGKVKGT